MELKVTMVDHPASHAISREMKKPKITPMVPPAKEIMVASTTNCRTMSDCRAPTARRKAYLARAFEDAGQHDVHDADAAHQQGDGSDGDHDGIEQLLGPLLLGQQFSGHDDAEVVGAVVR
jgi:hypothetical protein